MNYSPLATPRKKEEQFVKSQSDRIYNIHALRKSISWDSKRDRKIIEFFIYIIFLIVFIIYLNIVNVYSIEESFYIGNSLNERFFSSGKSNQRSYANSILYTNLQSISNEFDVWNWFMTSFLGTLYQETQVLPNHSTISTSSQKYYIGKYNRLMGSIRLLQWRVPKYSCDGNKVGSNWDSSCYGKYVFNQGDISPFGNSSQYTYQTCLNQGGTSIDQLLNIRMGSQFGVFYECDCSVYNLRVDAVQDIIQKELELLRDSQWIDHQTRHVAVEFVTSNPSLSLYTYSSISLEFLPSGLVVPSMSSITFTFDVPMPVLFYLTFSILFLFVIYFILIFIIQLISVFYLSIFMIINKQYLDDKETIPIFKLLKDPYLYIEFVNIILLTTSSITKLYFLIHNARSHSLISNDFPISYISYAKMFSLERCLLGISTILSLIRFLKMIRIFKSFYQIERFIRHAFPTLTAYILVFFVLYLGFALSANLLFGPFVPSLRSLDLAIINLSKYFFLTQDESYHRDFMTTIFLIFYCIFIVTFIVYFLNGIYSILKKVSLEKKNYEYFNTSSVEFHVYVMYRIHRIVEMIRTKRFVLHRPRSFQFRLSEYKKLKKTNEITHSELEKLFAFGLDIDLEYIVTRYFKSSFFKALKKEEVELPTLKKTLEEKIFSLENQIKDQNELLHSIYSMISDGSGKYRKIENKRPDQILQRNRLQVLKTQDNLDSNTTSNNLVTSEKKDNEKNNEKMQTNPRDKNPQSNPSASIPINEKSNQSLSKQTQESKGSIPIATTPSKQLNNNQQSPLQSPKTPTPQPFNPLNRSLNGINEMYNELSPKPVKLTKSYPEEHLKIISSILIQPRTSLERYKLLEDFSKSYGYTLKETREMMLYSKQNSS